MGLSFYLIATGLFSIQQAFVLKIESEEARKERIIKEDERNQFIRYKAIYRTHQAMGPVWGAFSLILVLLGCDFKIIMLVLVVLIVETIFTKYFQTKYSKLY